MEKKLQKAYFAGGCFWCIEGIFESQDGVLEVVSGYAGGDKDSATYEQVSTGKTKHREAVEILYDPTIISYEKLVDIFWTQIDPIDDGGQFADRGYQYTTAMYYQNDQEKQILEKSREDLEESSKFDGEIATKILPFKNFFDAEEYHQDFYKKSSERYKSYKKGSGREDFIKENWSLELEKLNSFEKNNNYTQEQLKSKLTDLQYYVTQEGGTEKAFQNKYWDNREDGIYVDIVDGTPLFSSTDKYESGTGWPSFTKAIDDNFIKKEDDYKLFMKRTEVKSKKSNSHLGHVFQDGPEEEGGLRYCINSAALNFIPVSKLGNTKYEKYLDLFE